MSFFIEDSKQEPNKSIFETSRRVEKDKTRPGYHFHPLCHWMNDPNGTFYHNGWYYLFYQFNPFGDKWEHIHWGQARSSNLVDWEYYPMGLTPRHDLDEKHCYSGCAYVKEGEPILYYTSVTSKEEEAPFSQRMAFTKEGHVWQQQERPFININHPGIPKVEDQFRDPYIYRDGDTAYLVLAAQLRESKVPVVLLFESSPSNMRDWTYKGVLKQFQNVDYVCFECPNFLKIGDHWTLFGSPYGPVEYYTGSFDPESEGEKLVTGEKRLLDYSSRFYATNTYQREGRTILVGWIRQFPEGLGWNGCLSLPRELTAKEGVIYQQPVEELRELREMRVDPERGAREGVCRLDSCNLSQSETLIESIGDRAFTVAVEDSTGNRLLTIERVGDTITVGTVTIELEEGETCHDLCLFIDRSTAEIFIKQGKYTVTEVLPALSETAVIWFQGEGEVSCWTLKKASLTVSHLFRDTLSQTT